MERAGIVVMVKGATTRLAQLIVQPTLRGRIIAAQKEDPYLSEVYEQLGSIRTGGFSLTSDDGLLLNDRLCVPDNDELKEELLTEAHHSPFTVHQGCCFSIIGQGNLFFSVRGNR